MLYLLGLTCVLLCFGLWSFIRTDVLCCFVLLEPTWMLYRVPRVSPGVLNSGLSLVFGGCALSFWTLERLLSSHSH